MQATNCVEFIGGPFDGHAQTVSLDVSQLAAVALLPVSRTIYAWLQGEAHPSCSPITSVAVYRLELDGEECHYRFTRSLDPERARLRS